MASKKEKNHSLFHGAVAGSRAGCKIPVAGPTNTRGPNICLKRRKVPNDENLRGQDKIRYSHFVLFCASMLSVVVLTSNLDSCFCLP